MTQGLRRIRSIPAGIAVLALLACSEDRREIEVSRVLRPLSEGIRWNVGTADRFGMRTTSAPPQVQAPMFAWDLPEGWTTLPPTEFRQADFRVAAHLDVECYMSVVIGGALANLNRWRGQMGLAGITTTEMEALTKREFFGIDAYYVEMAGSFRGMSGDPLPGHMLVGLVLAAPQQTLTLKLIGPEAAVRDELQRFAALAASFQLAPSQDAVVAPPGDSLDWTAPEGWRPSPPRPMTEVAFDLGENTACWISVLGFDGGGPDANIQRWRAEMGGAPVAVQQSIPIFGTQGTMIEISGRFGGNSAVAPIDDATMLAVSCGLGDRTIFVKMIGPRAEVQAHHQEFLEFCASLGE